MAGHQAPGENFHAFVLLTILNGLHDVMFLIFSREQIDPVCDGECDEIGPFVVVDFVLRGHG
jgi:hypothetical protein